MTHTPFVSNPCPATAIVFVSQNLFYGQLHQGTYFVLIDISEFLELPQFRGFTDLEFCEWMIKEIGVAAVPGSSFFREEVNNLIRLHFAREKETLDEALGRLEKLKELK